MPGPAVAGRAPRVPRGTRIYAVGDIHGRLDLLKRLEKQIFDDHAARGDSCVPWMVYLGDYIDRGFQSGQVIQHLVEGPPEGFEAIHLIGNHDLWLREFLEKAEFGPSWIKHGGDTTLLSYGVRVDVSLGDRASFEAAREILNEQMPDSHRTFLRDLDMGFSIGDYFFVHAGVVPDRPLEQQTMEDLIWIREPFLGWPGGLPKVVVHGHTVDEAPVERRHRIGIDTGACWTGRLTAVGLEEDRRWFLQTDGSTAAS